MVLGRADRIEVMMGTSGSCPAVLNFDRVRLMVPPKRERHSKEWWHMDHAIDGDGFTSPTTFVGSGVRSRSPRILRQRHERTEKAHRAAQGDLKFEASCSTSAERCC